MMMMMMMMMDKLKAYYPPGLGDVQSDAIGIGECTQ